MRRAAFLRLSGNGPCRASTSFCRTVRTNRLFGSHERHADQRRARFDLDGRRSSRVAIGPGIAGALERPLSCRESRFDSRTTTSRATVPRYNCMLATSPRDSPTAACLPNGPVARKASTPPICAFSWSRGRRYNRVKPSSSTSCRDVVNHHRAPDLPRGFKVARSARPACSLEESRQPAPAAAGRTRIGPPQTQRAGAVAGPPCSDILEKSTDYPRCYLPCVAPPGRDRIVVPPARKRGR